MELMNHNYALLVEDNPDEVVLAQMAFNKAKIESRLEVVRDGQEALDFLLYRSRYAKREPQEQPAVVLLDLKLPLVSGLEVLQTIRKVKSTSHIPVVILTCSMEDSDQVESYRLGANDFIRKPTSLIQFVEIIQQIKSKFLGYQRE